MQSKKLAYNPFVDIVNYFSNDEPRNLVYNDLLFVSSSLEKAGYTVTYLSELIDVIQYLADNRVLNLVEDQESSTYTISKVNL